MKIEITPELIKSFHESIERGKNIVITPFKPYISKPEPRRQYNADKIAALQASIDRGLVC